MLHWLLPLVLFFFFFFFFPTPSFKTTDINLDLNVYEIDQASLAYWHSFYLLFKTWMYIEHIATDLNLCFNSALYAFILIYLN